MKNKTPTAKSLAIIGTILVLLPVLAPIPFALFKFFRSGMTHFMFDYLMPAELFPVALIGGILLVIASLITRLERAFIIGAFIAAIILLAGGQFLAVITGMASGGTEPKGWLWVAVLTTIALYTLGLIQMGIGGMLLIKHLFKKS